MSQPESGASSCEISTTMIPKNKNTCSHNHDSNSNGDPDVVIRREQFLFHHHHPSHNGSGEDGNNINNNHNNLEDLYQVERQIARGTFGDVFLVTHRRTHHKQRAMKRLSKSLVAPDTFYREISLLCTVDHPNVLRLFESFEDSSYYYIITELATGGTLYDYLHANFQDMTEADMARLLKQLLICLNHCHAKQVIHGDIKPENILLERGDKTFERMVLSDFGLGRWFYDQGKRRMHHNHHHNNKRMGGTPEFVAPEIHRGNSVVSGKGDVWACGVLAFLLLVGQLPFEGTTQQEIYNQIPNRSDHFDLPAWEPISPQGKAFVQALLTNDEQVRPTAQEALEHPWLSSSILQDSAATNSQETTTTLPPAITSINASTPTAVETTSRRPTLASWNRNLIQFSAQQTLKQATYAFLVAQCTFKSRKKVMDNIFRSVDTNADGMISKQEIETALRATAKDDEFLLTDQDLNDIFERVDIDQNGYINYWEFLAATMNASTMLCSENLKIAFEMFDRNQSNSINAEDLKSIFSGNHRNPQSTTSAFPDDDDDCDGLGDDYGSDEEEAPHIIDEGVIEAIIQQVDANGDGEISYEEFATMMQENVLSSSSPTKRRHSSLEE